MRPLVVLCAAFALACTVLSGEHGNDWLSRNGLDDPRVGKIWDTAARAWVDREELLRRARTSDFVLLGEKHDNPDHHHLQGLVIQNMARERIPPTVALEMLSEDDRPALAAWYATTPEDVDALGDDLRWDKSGWPPYEIYKPVFMAAIARQLPLAPANLTRAEVAALRQSGRAGLPPRRVQPLALDPPLPAAARESLAEEIKASHCGMANDAMVGTMVEIQTVRDAVLADALLRAGAPAVLIAGAQHVRKDRGVPVYLGRRAPDRHVLSIAFVEVGAHDPETAAADEAASFDFLWWTPRVDDLDPCERFKEKLKEMHPAESGSAE